MTGESEAAGVWAALIGLAVFIAVTIVAGYWIALCADEARTFQPYSREPYTTIDVLWSDIPRPVRQGPITAAEKAANKARCIQALGKAPP